MPDVRDQLQSALGSAFTIERELVGGGMSRVFVATETALGRRVAIKVLSPELANAISAERFRREIQMVAQLQHPHIVPVHAAGEAEGCSSIRCPMWRAKRCARDCSATENFRSRNRSRC